MTDAIKASAPTGASALLAQRILRSLNESGLGDAISCADPLAADPAGSIFAKDRLQVGSLLRTQCEEHAFGFLDEAVDLSGNWSKSRLASHLEDRLDAAAVSHDAVCTAVLNAAAPREAAKLFLLQWACENLGETADTARAAYTMAGPVQRALWAVLTQSTAQGTLPLGYRTAFKFTLESVGLNADTDMHRELYLASSLALFNHFCLLLHRRRSLFHHLGALHFMEVGVAHAVRQWSTMLRQVFGDALYVPEFALREDDDLGSRQTVLRRLIMAAVDEIGTGIVPQILRGFEEHWLMRQIADADLLEQITWSDRRAAYRLKPSDATQRALKEWHKVQAATVETVRGQDTTTQVRDETALLVVRDGALDLATGFDQSVRLTDGEGLVIPRGRLHGAAPISNRCVYEVYPFDGAVPC